MKPRTARQRIATRRNHLIKQIRAAFWLGKHLKSRFQIEGLEEAASKAEADLIVHFTWVNENLPAEPEKQAIFLRDLGA